MTPRGLFAGLTTVDLQYLVDDYPAPNAKTNARRFHLSTGGPAANAAVTFSFLGGRSSLCTVVGQQPFTPFIHQELNRLAVELIDLAPTSNDLPPLSSIITTEGSGERAVVAYAPGVNTPDARPSPPVDVTDFDILLLDSYQLPVSQPLARAAREDGIPVVLDGGSWKEGLDALLPLVDIAICSADFHPPGSETGHESQTVFDYLHARGVRRGAITRGGQSILYFDGEQAGEILVPLVQVVDTLGAGDIFHGAFCYYFALQKEFQDALSQAATVAAKSCTSLGTRSWMNK